MSDLTLFQNTLYPHIAEPLPTSRSWCCCCRKRKLQLTPVDRLDDAAKEYATQFFAQQKYETDPLISSQEARRKWGDKVFSAGKNFTNKEQRGDFYNYALQELTANTSHPKSLQDHARQYLSNIDGEALFQVSL